MTERKAKSTGLPSSSSNHHISSPQRLPNQSSLFLFKDESADSGLSGVETKSSTSATSSALDLKELTNSLQKISADPIQLDANEVCESLDAENDDGHTEYKYKLVQPTPERIQHLVTQMNYRLTEGQGRAYYMLGVEDDGSPKGCTLLFTLHIF
jgi:hypothetical protein